MTTFLIASIKIMNTTLNCRIPQTWEDADGHVHPAFARGFDGKMHIFRLDAHGNELESSCGNARRDKSFYKLDLRDKKAFCFDCFMFES